MSMRPEIALFLFARCNYSLCIKAHKQRHKPHLPSVKYITVDKQK